MTEIIIRMNAERIKIKNAEYVQDLVRCKECKYWHSNTQFCDKFSHGDFIAQRMLPDDFCSCGEQSEKPTGSERSSE